MAVFLVLFQVVCRSWSETVVAPQLMDVATFLSQPFAVPLLLTLLGIAVAGGMFVVPLYAFLTTIVDKTQTARTIAANNIVNSGAMVLGSLLAAALSAAGMPVIEQLLVVALACLVSAWLARNLVRAERAVPAT
jgi:MFS family permease